MAPPSLFTRIDGNSHFTALRVAAEERHERAIADLENARRCKLARGETDRRLARRWPAVRSWAGEVRSSLRRPLSPERLP